VIDVVCRHVNVVKTAILESVRCAAKSVRWNTENVESVVDQITQNTDKLQSIVEADSCVDLFCNVLNDIVLPYCDVHTHSCKAKCDEFKSKRKNNVIEKDDKPWFSETCKTKYRKYKKTLHEFNINKTTDSHTYLIRKKKEYNKLELRLKRQYKRHEGDMIDLLRIQNPKEFHKYFSKRKTQTNNRISLNQFVEYFKDLGKFNDNNINNATIDLDGYIRLMKNWILL
jgi:hypothetical protein